MEARDIIMLRDPNAMVWISRNFKEFDCHNFATVNLVDVEREFLYKQFTQEYEDGPLFTPRDTCGYATDRMICFQKMIDRQPMDKILPLESISDLEIRETICNLYNIGLDANANLLKIQPNEVDD